MKGPHRHTHASPTADPKGIFGSKLLLPAFIVMETHFWSHFFGSRQIGVNCWMCVWWVWTRQFVAIQGISAWCNIIESPSLMSSSNPVFKHLFINTRQPKHSRFKGFLRYRAQECKKNTSPQKICPKLIGNLFSTRSEDNHLQSRLGQ